MPRRYRPLASFRMLRGHSHIDPVLWSPRHSTARPLSYLLAISTCLQAGLHSRPLVHSGFARSHGICALARSVQCAQSESSWHCISRKHMRVVADVVGGLGRLSSVWAYAQPLETKGPQKQPVQSIACYACVHPFQLYAGRSKRFLPRRQSSS